MLISFKNKDLDHVSACFEPNGLPIPLAKDEDIDLRVAIDESSVPNGSPFKIEIERQDGEIFIIFWEEYSCRYQVTSKGKIIIG